MQHGRGIMEAPKPDSGHFVYKRRKKKTSELDTGGKHTEQESVLVLGTPVKLQTTKVYARRKSITFQNGTVLSTALEATRKLEVPHASSAKEIVQEKGQGSNVVGTACFKTAYIIETVSDTKLEPQDIEGPVLDFPLYFKEETEDYACERSSDNEDSSFVVNKESIAVLNPATPGSKVDHFDMPSSFLVNHDKQESEENDFFPGEHGFVLLQTRTESEKNPYGHPRKKEDSQGVGGKEDLKGSGKAPRKKAKKRSRRPRIMIYGKSSRKTAKVRMKKPATSHKETVSKKRKKNGAEVVEPDTPGKHESSKSRKKAKKSKHEPVVEPVTSISLERGVGVKKVVGIAVARALIFDQESRPGEENLLTPHVHVDEHDNPNPSEIEKGGDAAETMKLSQQINFLDSCDTLGLKFPVLNKRRRIVRKPRADYLNLVFYISSAGKQEKSRKSNKRGNMPKAKRLLGFTWGKLSKRSARMRNMSKWTEISLCNHLPKRGLDLLGYRETKSSHAKGVPRTTCLAQEVQNNNAKEPILLQDNVSRSPGFDSRLTETSQMSKEMAWPCSFSYSADISRQDMAGRKYSINPELALSNFPTALQNYDLVQNIGQASCSSTEPYPPVRNLEHVSVGTHNGASLEHEGNLYQNQGLVMCNGDVATQNEDSRALYQNQPLMRLNLYPDEIPLQLQETRSLYENFMRSFDYVNPVIDKGLLYCGENGRNEDIEFLIRKMTRLVIDKRPLDLSVTMHSVGQLIVRNNAAQGPNTLVPCAEQEKQKTSAKVYLDPETIKEWQLLMTNDLPDGSNADEEREKKWEAEREFFRGRVDLFIKRMHILQADRKFKQWKGSVVDSVVGVYLTQNVSDHLSSNAYISLAATFPVEATEDTETGKESVDIGTGQLETVVNSDGLKYFIDEPLEENKNWSEVNDSVVEDQVSTHGSMSCKDLGATLSEEINRDGCIMLSFDRNGKVDHETSKEGTVCEHHRLGFHNMDTPEVQQPQKANKKRNKKTGVMEDEVVDWKSIRGTYTKEGPRDRKQADSADWDAVRVSDQGALASAIKDRGQQSIIAGRIKDFLNKEVEENGTIDLEWLRIAPPDLVKRYLLEINGLGLKSVECIRLLALKHIAFPVDTNVGRIAVRLGWVPLEPLPDEVQMHLLDQYPYFDSIQKYLWPRLCRLPQATLYELHYQLITFGKVFCTKRSPNCNACPMKAECKHFASAYASSQLRLPGSEDRKTENSDSFIVPENLPVYANQMVQITSIEENSSPEYGNQINGSEPIVEMPPSPTPEIHELIDIEDTPCRISGQPNGEIPEIDVDMEAFKKNVHDAMINIRKMLNNRSDEEVSKALVALTPENACIPMSTTKLKYYSRLRTEHVVYVLPDDHDLLQGFEKREPDDPSPYLLTVWQPGEKSHSFSAPKKKCDSNGSDLCNNQTCSYCCSIREENSKTLRGTILIPCRTAMRGRFPLNGTYFQINEVFADQQTSLEPIVFPRDWTHGLEKRALYCGSSVSAIFRNLDTRRIQLCFWTGYVCVRGFHREKRIPQELVGRLHTPPNKRGKKFERDDDE